VLMHLTGPATDMDGAHARSWRQYYHIGRPGVTGGDDGNGRLFFHVGSGEQLEAADWPRLSPPEPGETVAAFIDRAIVRDRLLRLFRPYTFRELVSPLAVVRPAERTLGWWKEKWPYRAPSLADSALADWLDEAVWGTPLPLDYHRDRVFWRLAVELFDRLRDGDLVVKGRRMDDLTSEVEVVKRGLLRNPFMVLRPRHRQGGLFVPEVWEERQPPVTLKESYCELTVWPAEARRNSPRPVPPGKLRRWWTEEYLPKHPEPDKRPNVGAQRAAAQEYFKCYRPPSEKDMQRLRADKSTPPEWVEKGRRGNSGR
jgi:hypothetical protein